METLKMSGTPAMNAHTAGGRLLKFVVGIGEIP